MELIDTIKQIKAHVLQKRVFPWMRNWCAVGPISLDGDRVPWLPTLFVGELVSGNVLENGDKATYSVDKAGHLQRFRDLRLGFTPDSPNFELYEVLTDKLPESRSYENLSSMYARRLYSSLSGSPLSIAFQVHFLAMCMGFSNFLILEDSVLQPVLQEFDDKSFVNAMKDACMRTSQVVAVEPKDLWMGEETPAPDDSGGSFFGE